MLVVERVTKRFRGKGKSPDVTALSEVSFCVGPGETVAVVGGSGAGKTTLARIVAGLETQSSGQVNVGGRRTAIIGGRPSRVQMVFQNPVDALNPWLSVGSSIAEPLRGLSKDERRRRVLSATEEVGLDVGRIGQRPHQFSGGQLQRIVLARALVTEPDVLLCDEPTSALDVSIQGTIVNLLLRLQAERGFACVLVTHDLVVARALADSVLVLAKGRVAELSEADDFFATPASAEGASLLGADEPRATGASR